MIVIEHQTTKERFRYPTTNVNKETPTGFIQYQAVPKGFKIALDQDNLPDEYFVHAVEVELQQYVETTNHEATSKDPLNTRKERY